MPATVVEVGDKLEVARLELRLHRPAIVKLTEGLVNLVKRVGVHVAEQMDAVLFDTPCPVGAASGCALSAEPPAELVHDDFVAALPSRVGLW